MYIFLNWEQAISNKMDKLFLQLNQNVTTDDCHWI